MLRRARLPLAVTITCLLISAGCGHSSANSESGVPVQIAVVSRHSITQIIVAEAVLFPIHEAALVPKVAAPVKKFFVNRGEKVHAGQLLAELENSDAAAAELENKGAYEQAQANYENARTSDLPEELKKAQFDAQQAKQELDAQQKVFDSRQQLFQQGALPRKDLDQAQVALTQARGAYTIAEQHLEALEAGGQQRRIQAAGAQLTEARGKYLGAAAQLSYTELRTPIAGVVTDRLAYPGQMAAAGDPVVTVMDLTQIIAKAHIPQQQAALVKVGDAATITSADSAEKVSGKVTIVSPALDPGSTTVEVWAQASNPGQKLKAGSSVQLEISEQSVANALVIPSSAIVTDANGGSAVMVVGADSKAHLTSVQIGIKQGDTAQIVSGVKEGDRVVTEGAYGLPDGTKVQAAPAKSEPASSEFRDDGDSRA